MHKGTILVSSFIFVIALLVSSTLFAESSVSKFENQILAFWISYDGGNTWTEVFSGESNTIDIASGDVGPQIGTYASGKQIPTGTITHFKVRCSNSVTIKGWVLDGGIYYYTDSSVPYSQTNTASTQAEAEANCTEITLSPPPDEPDFPLYFEDTNEISGGGIVVNEGNTIDVSISFDLSQMLTTETINVQGTDYKMIVPADPNPTISQI